MPNEGIDINNLLNRIEWLTKDCEDYQNKIKDSKTFPIYN